MRVVVGFWFLCAVPVFGTGVALADYNVIDRPKDYDQARLDWERRGRAEPSEGLRDNWRVEKERQSRVRRLSDQVVRQDDKNLGPGYTEIIRPTGRLSPAAWARDHWATLLAAAAVVGFAWRGLSRR